jgi:serine/threonine-protein kinase
MDYVRGTDAAALLKREGPLPVGRAVRLVCPMLDALAYAHRKRFVHRDLKPANLLITQEADEEVVRLADFGLARVYQASQLSGLTVTGEGGITIAFMPPEQVGNFRDVQPAADQYAAAATLYNLLTDRYVFDLPRETSRQISMVLQDDPVPVRQRRPELPAELAAVLHRALAKEPEDRFPDVQAFREHLAPWAGE